MQVEFTKKEKKILCLVLNKDVTTIKSKSFKKVLSIIGYEVSRGAPTHVKFNITKFGDKKRFAYAEEHPGNMVLGSYVDELRKFLNSHGVTCAAFKKEEVVKR